MRYAAQNMPPELPQVMSAHDLIEIEKGAVRLPGDWIVDPVADIRQVATPRVWVHSGPSNPISMSLGFSKRNGIFYVVVRHHDGPDYTLRGGVSYGDLSTAFSALWRLLSMLQDGSLKRGEPWTAM